MGAGLLPHSLCPWQNSTDCCLLNPPHICDKEVVETTGADVALQSCLEVAGPGEVWHQGVHTPTVCMHSAAGEDGTHILDMLMGCQTYAQCTESADMRWT